MRGIWGKKCGDIRTRAQINRGRIERTHFLSTIQPTTRQLSDHELITDNTDIMLEDYRDGQVYWWRVKERVLHHAGDSLGNKSGLHPNSHLLEMNSGKASRLSRSMALPSDPVKVMAKQCPWRRLSLHPAREAGEGRGIPRCCGREKSRRSLGKA